MYPGIIAYNSNENVFFSVDFGMAVLSIFPSLCSFFAFHILFRPSYLLQETYA